MSNLEIHTKRRESLEKAFAQWETQRSTRTFEEVREYFWQHLLHERLGTHSLVRKSIIEYFPKVWLACAEMNNEFQMSMWNYMTDFLTITDNLASVLKVEDSEKALGWFCCEHSKVYMYDFNSGYMGKFCKLLELWTSQTIPKDAKATIDQVVTLVYGPTVWDLYGCDLHNTDIIYKLPTELLNLNTPIAFRATKEKAAGTDLPRDFLHG